jgi:hypothetical protein
MNFFTFGDHWKVSPAVWLFFVTSVPVTIVALFVWAAYTDRKLSFMTLRKTKTQDEKPVEKLAEPAVPSKVHKSHLKQNASSSDSNQDLEAQRGADRT